MIDDTNAFAQYGTLCHELLEGWAKRELLCIELEGCFRQLYDQRVLHPFPPFPRGMGEKYFESGQRYFAEFEGFGEAYEIVAVEDRFEIELRGHLFVGVIDLVLRHKAGGQLVVIDHKSASTKTMNANLDAKMRQLYTYAAYVHEKFGEYPSMLRFNLFREGQWIDEPFCREKLNETFNWLEHMVQAIQAETEWTPNKSNFFCRFICGVNASCPVGKKLIYGG